MVIFNLPWRQQHWLFGICFRVARSGETHTDLSSSHWSSIFITTKIWRWWSRSSFSDSSFTSVFCSMFWFLLTTSEFSSSDASLLTVIWSYFRRLSWNFRSASWGLHHCWRVAVDFNNLLVMIWCRWVLSMTVSFYIRIWTTARLCRLVRSSSVLLS